MQWGVQHRYGRWPAAQCFQFIYVPFRYRSLDITDHTGALQKHEFELLHEPLVMMNSYLGYSRCDLVRHKARADGLKATTKTLSDTVEEW